MFISVDQAEISDWKNSVTDLKSRRSEEDDISDMNRWQQTGPLTSQLCYPARMESTKL